jgi:hypothetical protein
MQGTEHPTSLFKSVRQQKSNMCNSLTCTQTSYKEAPTRVQDFWLGSHTRCTRVQPRRRSGQLHHTPRLLVVRIAPALLRLCRASRHVVSLLDFSSVARTNSRSASDHCVSQRDYSSSGLHRLYCAYVVHPDASSCRLTSRRSRCSSSTTPSRVARRRLLRQHRASGCLGTSAAHRGARRQLLRLAQARRRLLRLRRASRCLGTLRGSSRGSSRRSSSTTLPRAGSSSTTSPPPRVRLPRHVAWLVTRLVAPLIIDYFSSRRLVVD